MNEEIGLALINIKLIITVALQDWLNLILDKLIIPPLLATLITVLLATSIAILLDILIAVLLAILTAAFATSTTPFKPTPIAVLLATLITAPVTTPFSF